MLLLLERAAGEAVDPCRRWLVDEFSLRALFLVRDGNAGEGRMYFTGSGRSAGGRCCTIVPNPMMRGRCSFGRSRISKLIGELQMPHNNVVRRAIDIAAAADEHNVNLTHPCSSQKKNKSRFRSSSASTAYGSLNSTGMSFSCTSSGRNFASSLSMKDNSLKPRISSFGTVGPVGISLLRIAGPCGSTRALAGNGAAAAAFEPLFLLAAGDCLDFFAAFAGAVVVA